MPAKAGNRGFLCCDKGKSRIPAFAGMTGWVSADGRSFGPLEQEIGLSQPRGLDRVGTNKAGSTKEKSAFMAIC
jgi:hypothetical protein